MLKFIGVAAIAVAAAVGAAVYFGMADVQVDAAITQQGQDQVQSLRDNLADQIRGETERL